MISTPDWVFIMVWISVITGSAVVGYALWAFAKAFMEEVVKRDEHL